MLFSEDTDLLENQRTVQWKQNLEFMLEASTPKFQN